MTTMQQAAEIGVGRQTAAHTGRRVRPGPLAVVALAAAIVGGIAGGAATALATDTVFNDRAAEQARLVQFAEQLKYALRWDDLYRQMYPFVDE